MKQGWTFILHRHFALLAAPSVEYQNAFAAIFDSFSWKQNMSKGRVFIHSICMSFSVSEYMHKTQFHGGNKKKGQTIEPSPAYTIYIHVLTMWKRRKEYRKRDKEPKNRWPFMRLPLSFAVCNKSGHEIYIRTYIQHLPFNFIVYRLMCVCVHTAILVKTHKICSFSHVLVLSKLSCVAASLLNWRMKRRQWRQQKSWWWWFCGRMNGEKKGNVIILSTKNPSKSKKTQ